MAFGCGRKGPPRPPRLVVPPPVSDLRAEVLEERIILSWSVPAGDDEAASGIEAFRVFRFRTDAPEQLCAGCPVDFRRFETVTVAGPIGSGTERRMTVYDVWDPGYGYMYKVIAVHETGGVSDHSNIATLLP